jgi:hypothetical protein
MTSKRCPGMDPAYFKPDDIGTRKCTNCSAEIEFWKDDVFLACPACTTRNVNPGVESTCLAWCKEAASCVGNMDIREWLRMRGAQDGDSARKG